MSRRKPHTIGARHIGPPAPIASIKSIPSIPSTPPAAPPPTDPPAARDTATTLLAAARDQLARHKSAAELIVACGGYPQFLTATARLEGMVTALERVTASEQENG